MRRRAVEDLQRDVASLQQRTIALAANIRHISHDLHPSVLEHAGLVAALTAYCTEVQQQQTVAVTFSAEGDFASTDADVALCLYRIAQEALRNVVAHADARRADVRLRRLDDSVELTIADDGKGFDVVGARADSKGLGLVSINERVRLAGGTVSYRDRSEQGHAGAGPDSGEPARVDQRRRRFRTVRHVRLTAGVPRRR